MSAARFLAVAAALTSRRRVARPRRFDTPGRPLGSIPLFRFCPG